MNRPLHKAWLLILLLFAGQVVSALPMAMPESAGPAAEYACHESEQPGAERPMPAMPEELCSSDCFHCAGSCSPPPGLAARPLALIEAGSVVFSRNPLSAPSHRKTSPFRPPIIA